MPDRYRHFRVTFAGPAEYRIVVEGYVDERLSERLGGMEITSMNREDGSPISILSGRITDQAELMGLLNTLYDLHVPILSAEAVD